MQQSLFKEEQSFPEDHSKASRRETPELVISSCDEQPPPLIPVTVVQVYESSERESPTPRLIPRWMLLAIFMLGLLLVFPFLRRPQSRCSFSQKHRSPYLRNIGYRRHLEPLSLPLLLPPSLRVPASVQGPQPAQAAPALHLLPDTSIPPDPLLRAQLKQTQGPHWLNIQAKQEVWLSVPIDQVEKKETFLKPGDQVNWVAKTNLVVSANKPNRVRLIFNGNILAPVHERE